jgi:hypothetical protein
MMDVIEQLAAHMLADAIPSRASDDVEAAAIKNAANRCRQIANSNLGSRRYAPASHSAFFFFFSLQVTHTPVLGVITTTTTVRKASLRSQTASRRS